MTTANLNGVDDVVAARLLTFVPTGGTKLDTLLPGGMWMVEAPDDRLDSMGTNPYAVLRRIPTQTAGDDGDFRQVVTYELTVYARSRDRQNDVETAMDAADQAMWKWVYNDADGGLVYSTTRRRETMPPYSPPADRELVCVRSLYEVHVWPKMLTQYGGVPQ